MRHNDLLPAIGSAVIAHRSSDLQPPRGLREALSQDNKCQLKSVKFFPQDFFESVALAQHSGRCPVPSARVPVSGPVVNQRLEQSPTQPVSRRMWREGRSPGAEKQPRSTSVKAKINMNFRVLKPCQYPASDSAVPAVPFPRKQVSQFNAERREEFPTNKLLKSRLPSIPQDNLVMTSALSKCQILPKNSTESEARGKLSQYSRSIVGLIQAHDVIISQSARPAKASRACALIKSRKSVADASWNKEALKQLRIMQRQQENKGRRYESLGNPRCTARFRTIDYSDPASGVAVASKTKKRIVRAAKQPSYIPVVVHKNKENINPNNKSHRQQKSESTSTSTATVTFRSPFIPPS